MGDHRVSITIKMSFHGAKDELVDGWFNWDGGRDGIDSRILKFIEAVRDRGFEIYDHDMEKYWREQNKVETEKSERAEYNRLKKKFDGEING